VYRGLYSPYCLVEDFSEDLFITFNTNITHLSDTQRPTQGV
jgi:hypothetical protein